MSTAKMAGAFAAERSPESWLRRSIPIDGKGHNIARIPTGGLKWPLVTRLLGLPQGTMTMSELEPRCFPPGERMAYIRALIAGARRLRTYAEWFSLPRCFPSRRLSRRCRDN